MVYEDEEVLVINDKYPSAPVHMLVMPKKHIEEIGQARDEESELLGKMLIKAADMAKKANITDGYKLCLNAGRFQEIPHIHLHVRGGWDKGKEVDQ